MQNQPIETLFFDLDDTLYPASCGLWRDIRARIDLYMRDRLSIPAEQVMPLRRHYYETYGTALRGLEREYPLDKADFLAFVHDLPVRDYIAPNPGLRAVIEAIPTRKFIFTNADSAHASRILTALGLEDCFEAVVDVLAVSPYCKPMPESFKIALQVAGSPNPRRCVILDDMPRTTIAARALGMFSVLVSENASLSPDADAILHDWAQLPALLEEARARSDDEP
ncbi:MAG: pyrimidine 5'-nucleotidase [Anaerolineales bacterium]|jgi:putative hydrolase of the HAD superfamily|nr:pyrimidine 5'-nucleotidase [Anaerolineales bacterium]